MWPLISKSLPGFSVSHECAVDDNVEVYEHASAKAKIAVITTELSILGSYNLSRWCSANDAIAIFSQRNYSAFPVLASCSSVELYPFALFSLNTSTSACTVRNLKIAQTMDYASYIQPHLDEPAVLRLREHADALLHLCGISGVVKLELPYPVIRTSAALECIVVIDADGRMFFTVDSATGVLADTVERVVYSAVVAYLALSPGLPIITLLRHSDSLIEHAVSKLGFVNVMHELNQEATPSGDSKNDNLCFVAKISALSPHPECAQPCSLRHRVKVDDIYLMIGQSNMAGRGALHDVQSKETQQFINRLAPEFRWNVAALDGSNGYYSYDPIQGWIANR